MTTYSYIVGTAALVWFFILLTQLVGIAKRLMFVNKYLNYLKMQEYLCELAYEFIYKDQVVAFSASGYKVSGDELETVKRNFIKLAIQLMGPNLESALIEFYGSSESLTTNLLVWFTRKLDSDEILKYTEQTEKSRDGDQLEPFVKK